MASHSATSAGGVLTFNFHGNALLDQEATIVFLGDVEDLNIGTNPLAGRHRRQEAHLVEAVIEAHHHTFR